MLIPRIWQAPTGSIAGPELCTEVAKAGGVGAMGLTWTDPATTREWVMRVRSETAGPFLVNYALAFEPTGLAAALESGAPIVSFSWGDASPHTPLVRSFGARLGIQVVNADAARRATNLGADFLICQGIEAGGHVESTTPLAQLLPEIVEAAQGVPVIAAGGLATGDDADRVLKAGAAGAMFGTRFVASEESRAHPIYKQRLVDSSETSLTYCFDGGWPNASHRVLVNQTLKDWEAAGSPSAGRPGEREILAEWEGKGSVQRYSDAAPQRGMSGAVDKMCLYAGTGCGRIDAILPAAEIMRRLSGFNFANPGRDPDRLK